ESTMSRSFALAWLAVMIVASTTMAQTAYKTPPKEVVDILDAPPTPLVEVSPTRDAMLLVEPQLYPPIRVLAQPILRIGGVRINPKTGCRQRLIHFTGMEIRPLDGTKGRRIELPDGARVGRPSWSPDGKRFAFGLDRDDGVELWVGDPST